MCKKQRIKRTQSLFSALFSLSHHTQFQGDFMSVVPKAVVCGCGMCAGQKWMFSSGPCREEGAMTGTISNDSHCAVAACVGLRIPARMIQCLIS